MNTNSEKVLLPNDVRRLLNVDNREIVELCKKTSVSPKKNKFGQIYFSIDEVKRLKNAKSSIITGNGIKKMNNEKTLPVMTKPNSQAVVNNLLETLNQMENNITSSMTKLIDEKLEGMDDVVLELVRCKTENENLKNKVNELNKENFKLKNILSSFKPLFAGFYIKKEEENNILL
jgi:predicted RNase H-like nuclease (RuvC/YqgF family)